MDLTYEVEIERIIPRGFGLAHIEGKTVFVSLAVPGDRVLVRDTEVKGSIAFAEIVEILRPSPERVDAPCPYFGSCGGCDFQQMSYDEQLRSKVAMIRDCIRRIAKYEFEDEIRVIRSPEQFGYRSRAQWHLETPTQGIGYYKRNSRELIPIEVCPKLVPELNSALTAVRADFPWERVPGSSGYIDAAVGSNRTVSLNSPGLYSAEEISFLLGELDFRYSAELFFQGNQFLIPALVEAATNGAAGLTALDLYCGVGLFTLPLAQRFSAAIGVEENQLSVEYAKKNASLNGIENAEFHVDSVGSYLGRKNKPKPDFVLLDPPRAGTEKVTMMRIIELGAEQISYVACEPSIFARDLKRLAENGYRLESLTAIDLFPQTHHVETVARLIKT